MYIVLDIILPRLLNSILNIYTTTKFFLSILYLILFNKLARFCWFLKNKKHTATHLSLVVPSSQTRKNRSFGGEKMTKNGLSTERCEKLKCDDIPAKLKYSLGFLRYLVFKLKAYKW